MVEIDEECCPKLFKNLVSTCLKKVSLFGHISRRNQLLSKLKIKRRFCVAKAYKDNDAQFLKNFF